MKSVWADDCANIVFEDDLRTASWCSLALWDSATSFVAPSFQTLERDQPSRMS